MLLVDLGRNLCHLHKRGAEFNWLVPVLAGIELLELVAALLLCHLVNASILMVFAAPGSRPLHYQNITRQFLMPESSSFGLSCGRAPRKNQAHFQPFYLGDSS
jgi:hypothetical protein